ncbi:hypothetical protein ACFW9O_30685 [Streptomyces sp. NPDC059499]|uniref:hypothetical protein n=1 Tax=Streptomyces sp. NPDC059499 TaxID=3346852 RepID=UPI0036AD83BF
MSQQLPVHLEDVLGTRTLGLADLTIGELLAANRLPETMFQPYVVKGATATPVPLTTRLDDLPEDAERLLVRAIRNTLFPTVLPADGEPLGPVGPPGAGIGFRSVRTAPDGTAHEVHATVGQDEARSIVASQVAEFEEKYALSDGGCVFGISGGGDSNALAYGLANSVPRNRLTAFTLVFGAVFSPEAAVRAGVLCQDLGIDHRVLSPEDIAELLGVRTSMDELYKDFSDTFTHEALHFFGTFLILRTARKLADQQGLRDLAFGYNREDLLAEAMFMVMNGRRPLSYPVRTVGRHRVVMPVWKAPKLLLDACHPNFSLENYRERDPYTTRQRSLAFFLAHAMDSAYPSFGLSVLTGMSQAFDGAWGEVTHHEDLDVFVTEQASTQSIEQVRRLLSRHFGEGAVN